MEKKYSFLGGAIKLRFVLDNETGEIALEDSEEKKNQKSEIRSPSNADVPYEVRMKYIIDAYRKDQEKWAKLAEYTKHLEGEVIRLKEILIDNGYTDSGASEDWTPDKEIADLKKKIKKLEEKIEIDYPQKKKQNINMKKVMTSQASFIVKLQYLLDKHGISYITPKPLRKITQEDIDNIDVDVVR